MALWSSIDSDAIPVIAHLERLGLEQTLFLDEVDAVANQVQKTGINHSVAASVILTVKGVVSSCANIRINKSALP